MHHHAVLRGVYVDGTQDVVYTKQALYQRSHIPNLPLLTASGDLTWPSNTHQHQLSVLSILGLWGDGLQLPSWFLGQGLELQGQGLRLGQRY